MARTPDAGVPRAKPITIRVSDREAYQLGQQQADRQFTSASAYLRWLVRNDQVEAAQARKKRES